MTAVPRVRRDEVDGVPVFWVDSGRSTLTAHLQFRTGSADETLPTSGLTHLAQHLALVGLPPRDDREVGGSTDLLRTTLRVQGAPAGVRRFLIDVCEWLDGPDLSRVVREASVLHARREGAGRTPTELALLRRYGARGPGLVGFDEPGLCGATVDAVRDVVHTRLTRGNAALVLDGPPPAGFRLPLREGPRRPVRQPAPAGGPRPAAHVATDTVTVSGEVGLTTAASLLPELLRRALERDLRDLFAQPPTASATWATSEQVGPEAAVVTAGCVVAPALRGRVVEHAHGAVDALRRNGPQPAALAEVAAAAVRLLEDPDHALRLADAAAWDHLDGRPAVDARSHAQQLAGVTVEDVQVVAEGFAGSLLLGVPARATWTEDLPLLAMPTRTGRPAGPVRRSRNSPAERSRLVVGPDAVHVGRRSGWCGIRYDEVEAVLARPDGAREVVAADGWSLTVEPTLWVAGEEAVAALDGAVPADRVVTLPERPPYAVPRAGGFRERWSAVPHLLTGLVVALAVALLVLAVASGQLVLVAAAVIGGLVAVTLVATRGSGGRLDSAA